MQLNDGAYAVPTEGPDRGNLKRFFGSVAGSEIASGIFNADSTALFLSIQHPDEGGTFDKPISSWPDGANPPKPSVVVAWNQSGGPVGTGVPSALPRTGELALPGAIGVAAGAAAVAAGALVRFRARGQRKEQETTSLSAD